MRRTVLTLLLLAACDRSAAKLDKFCHTIRLDTRNRSLVLDNKALREGAGRELMSSSYKEAIALCLDHEYDFDREDKCWIVEDYACLKAEADKIAAALDAR